MGTSKKTQTFNKIGLSRKLKKTGVNDWRYFFSGVNKQTGVEKVFCLELEMINPFIAVEEPVLGYKPRINFTSDDLQYSLAGTASATQFVTEEIVRPSFVAIKISLLGKEYKQLCRYVSFSEVKINTKEFEIQVGNIYFSNDSVSGFIDISAEECERHPEYFSNSGYCSWNLTYDVHKDFAEGFKNKEVLWFPLGLDTVFNGVLNFDGNEYLIYPKKSFGYIERFWGNSYPPVWFHVSSSNLTSIITGQHLFNSSFVAKGVFDDRLSFLASFENTDIIFSADSSKHDFNVIWDCNQMPSNDEDNDPVLHWSVSLNSKIWVIDIDVFCKIKDLANKNFEIPEGNRKLLSMVQAGTGSGEIKLYKRIKNTLEQIEHAKLYNVVCEFGQISNTVE